MTLKRRLSAGLFATMALPVLACLRPPFDAAHARGRALEVSVDTKVGSARLLAFPFPPLVRTHPTRAPLVVVAPLLFRYELLLQEGGLVATLEEAGFPVWLVVPNEEGTPDARLPSARAMSAAIARALSVVAEATGPRIDVLSLGLSGAPTLEALLSLQGGSAPFVIGKLALVGTPLDTAYPNSFAERAAAVFGEAASSLCSLNAGTMCQQLWRDPAAVTWLGALPPRDAHEALGTHERYVGIENMTAPNVLFIAGKADGVAPTESMFPVYEAWGKAATGQRRANKRFFVAGVENGLPRNFDGYALLARSDGGDAVWEQVVAFLSE